MAKQAITTEYTVISEKISRAFRIALVADIHERRQDDIIALIKKARPDMIAVAGDTFERFISERAVPAGRAKMGFWHRLFLDTAFFVNYFFVQVVGKNNRCDTQNSYRFIKEAAKLAPVYMSLGNHEERLLDGDIAVIKDNGVVLLDNSDVSATVGGVPLRIGGLSTYYDEKWLQGFSQGDGFKLLLCHHPEYFDRIVADKNIDLVLSGHNHGGQIRLFGKPMLSAGGGLCPKYVHGVYRDRLIVSSGCSNTAFIPRLFNPRELVVINVRPDSANKPR